MQVQSRGRLGDVEVRVDVRIERQAGLWLSQCRPDRDRDEICRVVASERQLVEEAQVLGGDDRTAVVRMPERAPSIAVARRQFRQADERAPDSRVRPQSPGGDCPDRLAEHDRSPARPMRVEYREDFLVAKDHERGSLGPACRLEWTEIHWLRVRDGAIVEHWSSLDRLGIMQQRGAIPTEENQP